MSTRIHHIAVIRLSAMGDVAMTVPVLRALSQQHPNVRITMVSRPFFKPFFDGIANLDFLEFDEKGRHHGVVGLIRLYSDLRKQKIDAFADLHNVLRSKVVTTLFKLIGITTATVDKARAEKKALTRSENKIFAQLKPITQRHAEVLNKLGLAIDLSKTTFPDPIEMDSAVHAFAGEKLTKWIGIAPFAQYDSKIYPRDLMQNVISTLAKSNSYKLFLFGGRNEIEKLRTLAAANPNVEIVAGKLNFAQELQLISNLDLMLSMDSGNAHISAMYGVKTVTLWGATHPFAGFAPFAQPAENAITSNRTDFPMLPTSVYGNKIVDGYQDAMRTISPEAVVARIESLLEVEG